METPLNTMWQEAVRPKKGANGPKAIDLTEKCAAIGLEAIDLNEKSGTTGPKAIDRTEEGGSIGLKSIDSTEKGSAIGLEAIDPHTQTDSDNELLEIINDLLEIDDSYTKSMKSIEPIKLQRFWCSQSQKVKKTRAVKESARQLTFKIETET